MQPAPGVGRVLHRTFQLVGRVAGDGELPVRGSERELVREQDGDGASSPSVVVAESVPTAYT